MHRRSFGRAMQWDAHLPSDLVEQLWRDPRSLLAEGQTLQEKPRCTVVRLQHPQGLFTLKHHNWGGPIRTFKKSLRRAPAKQSWLDGRHLYAAGVPTPRPLAYVEYRLGPLGVCSYLLTEYIAGTTLYRLMRHNQPSEEVVLHFARQVAGIWQKLDDLCISHNDMKTENFMIDLTGRVWLIDLEKMRRHRHPEQARRRHAQDASRMFHPRNWRTNPEAAEIFRQQILRTSAGSACASADPVEGHPLCRPVPSINRSSQLVTVLIPCRNDAQVISDCVNSVRDIADEILVADAGSSDNTLEIVRRLGNCRIIQRSCDYDVEFENWAAEHARHEWILRILPFERLSPDLAKETQDLLAKEPADDGFYITRRYCYWGKLLRYGMFRHDSSVRLYRRGKGHHEMRKGRIEVVIPSGNTGHLLSKLHYQAYWNVGHYFKETMQFAANGPDQAPPLRRNSNYNMVPWRALWKFFESYVLRFGWLDGWIGLHASCLAATSIYLREVQHWDQSHPQSQFAAPEHGQFWKTFIPDSLSDLTVLRPAALSAGQDNVSGATATVSSESVQQQKRSAA